MLININVEDIYSKVLTPEVIGVVRDVCRAQPKGYQFMPRYKARQWNGYISLMGGWNKFPTGLLDNVVDELEARGHKIHISNDSRIAVPKAADIQSDMLADITLRDYQVKAANELLAARRGIAKMATNSGKTEVMSAIIKAINKKTVVLVHIKELLHQTAKRIYERTGMEVGVIGDGIYDPQQVTVCMVQSLSKRLRTNKKHFEDNIVVIVDECHHTSSNQMLDTIFKLPGCYRFGFSGTPLKYEDLADLKLVAATGPVVYELGNDYMIESGWSAKPSVKLHIVDADKEDELTYMEAYDQLIVNNSLRNSIISDISKNASGVVLVLVNRIEHGKLLGDLIPGATFVHGNKSTDYRMNVSENMKTDPGVYIATPIFDEGIDVPAIDVVVLAGGGKSHIKLLQRIGRGLRKKDGNNVMEVHDFIDDTNKYLFKHSEKRVQVYASEGFGKEIVR